MHHFGTEMRTFLFQSGVLWDMGQVQCWSMPGSPSESDAGWNSSIQHGHDLDARMVPLPLNTDE